MNSRYLLALAAMLFANPLSAQDAAGSDASSSDPAGDIVVQGQQDDPALDKIICKTEKVVGSRLNSAKRCQSRRQWIAERASNRRDVEKVQTQRWKSQ